MTEQLRPLVAAAFLCEKVLTEKDNVQTFVRVVDTLIAADGRPRPPFQIWLVVMLKAGQARGKYFLSLRVNSPSGKASPIGEELPVAMDNDEATVNVNALLTLDVQEEGLYWIDVLVDGAAVTRVPFRVRLEPSTSTKPERETFPEQPGDPASR
jgi:Family of unknown function (DUF6941)